MLCRTLLTALLALAPIPALAQAHSHGPANGGQLLKVGTHEAELAVKGGELSLYVEDANEKKADASRYSATAVVLAKGNEQRTVELKPAGDNRLAGKVDFPVEGKLRATVTLKMGDTEVGKGRYSLDQR